MVYNSNVLHFEPRYCDSTEVFSNFNKYLILRKNFIVSLLVLYIHTVIMIRKKLEAKKTISKNKEKVKGINKIVKQRGDELLKWKMENAVQKRFFSLEDREQKLLEKTYIVFAQVCPELTREDYLNRLSKSDKLDTVTKAVLKKVIWI